MFSSFPPGGFQRTRLGGLIKLRFAFFFDAVLPGYVPGFSFLSLDSLGLFWTLFFIFYYYYYGDWGHILVEGAGLRPRRRRAP